MTRTFWHFVDRALSSTTTVYAACAASLALGLFFIFVWSPLPWGWQGIDFYYEIALSLASGEPFPTMHLVWGYAYFLAFWYWLFGDHQWVPLTAQAVLNASIPLMLYHMVRIELGARYGVMAAVLAGLLSFNTIYTSTQASDSVCTVLVMATMLCLSAARARRRPALFALAGVLAGIAFQFRPNFVLFPFFFAGLYLLVAPRPRVKWLQMSAFVLAFVLAATPWVVRNYRWSGLFVPASTHGGIQLWFGSLQTGEYQSNWFYHPQAAVEFSAVDYNSLDTFPVIVSGRAAGCGPEGDTRVEFVYWTNRDSAVRRVPVPLDASGRFTAALPVLPAPTAISYYLEASSGTAGKTLAPAAGPADPGVFVLSRDHLGDLDVGGQLLDVFDVARLARHLAWGEALPASHHLDLDADGALTEKDLRFAGSLLADERDLPPAETRPVVTAVTTHAASVVLQFTDGSTLTVPKATDGRITDLVAGRGLARLVMSHARSFASVEPRAVALPRSDGPGVSHRCLAEIGLNQVPYRRQPHLMNRYTALSLDNIKRAPVDYALASAYRAVRLFVIEGSDDRRTAAQFSGSSGVYLIGRAVTAGFAALLVAGLIVAIRRQLPVFMFLTPIVYVPATIAFMLINARYAMTAQPFMFALIAVLLVTVLDRLRPRGVPTPESPSAKSGWPAAGSAAVP
jgi:hypothetical protein